MIPEITREAARRDDRTGPIVKESTSAAWARTSPGLDRYPARPSRCSQRWMIYFDVSDLDLEGYNKFIPYYLHPDALYSVGVSASPTRAKVSVGTNPWKEASAEVNLASLCEEVRRRRACASLQSPSIGKIWSAPEKWH